MGNTIQTAFMNMPEPVPGQDPGPQYALDISTCLNILDQHNHSPGYGALVPTSGININTDLPFNQNNLILVRSVRFSEQTSVSGGADLTCLYVESDGNLYYNDAVGNTTQIIKTGGGVNATSSGIASGTATASFSAGVLVVNAATNTPANIQGASLLMGNNSAGSNYLTLSPPNAMSANYSLVLPSLPASTLFLTLDTSGNIATAASIQPTQIAANSIQGSQIANSTITGTQIVSNINLAGDSVQENGKNVVVSNSNATNSLAIIRGVVSTTTGVVAGEGFSVARNGVGDVTITWNFAFNDTPAVTFGVDGGTGPNTAQHVIGPTASNVRVFTFQGSSQIDNIFSFIAIGQRA